MPFSKLGLADELVQGILATGYTAPTAIQERAIPLAIAGRDIIGCAQTGTGKTAAFALPMLNHFLKHKRPERRTRGLVLTPTRELAQQVEEFVTGYGRFTHMNSLAVFGGVSMENQIKHLHRGVDIVVATPGRLIDHLNRRTVDLSHVEIFVLDEADRMFDMGFIADVRKIIARIPAKRQTLLFSATMSKEVRELTASIQHNPEFIQIGEQRRPVETVKQHFYSASQERKLDLLFHMLRSEEMDSVLIFSRTKHGADKITRKLERGGMKAVAIHSNRTQAQRQRALAGFKQGQYKIMVATDIAARGIDVEGISHVVNYDTPTFAEDYIHRIGRTGRAAATGDAVTFVSNQEHKYFKSIERYTDKQFDLKRYPGFDYAAKQPVPEKLHEEKSKEEKHHEVKRHEEKHKEEKPRHQQSGHRQERTRDHHQHGQSGASGKDRRAQHRPEQARHVQHRPEQARHVHAGEQRMEKSERPRHGFREQKHRKDEFRRTHDQRERAHESRKPVAPPVPPLAPDNDWRTLMASMEENRDSLKKKIKRLFIREKIK